LGPFSLSILNSAGSGQFPLSEPILISSWNVNGFRNNVQAIRDYLKKSSPDLLCLQEIKFGIDNKEGLEFLKEEVFSKYCIYLNCSSKNSGQHGTLILSKYAASDVWAGMGSLKHEAEGRIIVLEFLKFFIVGVYAPNPITSDKNYKYRAEEWDLEFIEFIRNLKANNSSKELLIVGDLNVSCDNDDVEENEIKRNFYKLLSAGGLVDAHRIFNQQGTLGGWTYQKKPSSKNLSSANPPGKRLDYVLISSQLTRTVQRLEVNYQSKGSDHFPVELTLVLNKAVSAMGLSEKEVIEEGKEMRNKNNVPNLKSINFHAEEERAGVNHVGNGCLNCGKGDNLLLCQLCNDSYHRHCLVNIFISFFGGFYGFFVWRYSKDCTLQSIERIQK